MSENTKRVVGWVITVPYLVLFVGILVFFHFLQVIAALLSARLHKHVLDLMNLCIIWNIRITAGTSMRVIGTPCLPPGRPVMIVSNHQSMYDIPMIMWLCRSREVGFIAKRELGRWIPSVSFALRKLGSVMIDRRDAKQAVAAIRRFGEEKVRDVQVACIFPEGTRARDGMMKRFKPGGILTLAEAMPNAVVQPMAIDGNWELLRYGFRPVPFGTSVTITFLPPLDLSSLDRTDLPKFLEDQIRKTLGQGEILESVPVKALQGNLSKDGAVA